MTKTEASKSATQNITEAEAALHALMLKVSALPKMRGACEWAVIAGRRIMCAPTYHKADGSFKTWRFVVDGKLTKFDDLAAICRAAGSAQ